MSHKIKIVCATHSPELVIFEEQSNSPPYFTRDNILAILWNLKRMETGYKRLQAAAEDINAVRIDNEISPYTSSYWQLNKLFPHAYSDLIVF